MSHIQAKFQTSTVERGQQRVTAPKKPRPARQPRTPHITKLMALAIRLEELLATGQVKDQAEIASTAGITHAGVTQIMNLNNLAPSTQADILNFPQSELETPQIIEREIGQIAKVFDWTSQKRHWEAKLRLKSKARKAVVRS